VLDPEHPFTEDEYFAFCMANSTLRIERTAQGEIDGTAAEFLRLVPDFVAELMSPSDRLPIARAKMEEWIANGVALGWLIDGDAQTVYVCRIGKATGVTSLPGDGRIAGFMLDLTAIWAGL
jgi:Uma2 family endonuclease